MSTRLRPLLRGATAILLVSLPIGIGAQVEFTNNVKYDSGQDVQPVFEGWNRTANGSFDLYFGYLNRNWVQEIHVPVGPANSIQPGGPDRGQPTFFYTRTNRKAFIVNVPADFGKSEVTWTLTVNGKTRTAFGHLRPDWEITPDGGAAGTRTTAEARTNKAPSLAIAPVSLARVGATTTLAATVSDDGLPAPRGRAKPAVGQETPSALVGVEKDLPSNVPRVRRDEASLGAPPGGDGLSVKWVVFRGPAGAKFEPDLVRPTEGQATTSATFAVPGEYTLRAAAHDGLLTTSRDVTLTVTK